jgi:outer membrane protein, heavy metal efflux system
MFRAIRLLGWIPAFAGMTVLAAPPLSLDEALRLAQARSPQLAAQVASAAAAAALVPAAGQNPDPKLIAGVENLPVQGGDRWSLTRDFMTMRKVGVMQDFVRGSKREGREARADAEARRELAIVEMQRADLRREVATAWFERFYAARSRELIGALASEAQLQSDASTAELAAGRGSASDALAARALRATLADRDLETQRQSRRAEAMLTRWLGEDASRTPVAQPDIEHVAHHAGDFEANLERHPHLAMFAPMIAMAEAELRLAQAAKDPDWSVELSYAQRGPEYANMVSVMFRMELPVFAGRRQDPVIESKRRALDQAQAQAEDARRRHVAEIRAWLADWEIAKARLERHRKDIVPYAEERARLAQSAYAGGRADLASVFDARRMALDARIAALGAEAELARAWVQLAYLLPDRRDGGSAP